MRWTGGKPHHDGHRSGIEKIKAACIADGLPEPEFRISTTEFMVCFHIRNNNKAIAERAAGKRNIVSEGTINSGDNSIYSANASGINSGINEIRQNILIMMRDEPSVTTAQIAATLKLNQRNVEAHIRALKKAGVVEREGAKKNGRWVVKLTSKRD